MDMKRSVALDEIYRTMPNITGYGLSVEIQLQKILFGKTEYLRIFELNNLMEYFKSVLSIKNYNKHLNTKIRIV